MSMCFDSIENKRELSLNDYAVKQNFNSANKMYTDWKGKGHRPKIETLGMDDDRIKALITILKEKKFVVNSK